MSITKSVFDKTADGQVVYAYALERGGIRAVILNFGGILQSLCVPDANGVCADVVCGFDTVEGYLTGGGYHGALIGRYANRIRDGRFVLNGEVIQLNRNENGICTLHGGDFGFNVRMWEAEEKEGKTEDSLVLSLFSPDGDEHFPGNLHVKVTYTLKDDRALCIRYEADTDRDTVVNLTNHSYFNLGGYDSGDICDHIMTINAPTYAQIDGDLLPTGEQVSVEGTAFDFRHGAKITGEYDHSFFLDGAEIAADVTDPVSTRRMQVMTDMPAIQFYTGNFLGGDVPFKGGVKQEKHHGFCLETQYTPDSPNQPQWPSPVLHAGEHYDKTTVFRFL